MRVMLKSKIHRATVTSTNLQYGGSVTISKDLMEKADILPYEQVTVLNLNNGARFETYAIPGESGKVCLNGACARLGEEGDKVIILSYEIINTSVPDNRWDGVINHSPYKPYPPPNMVYVDENNAIIERNIT